MSIGVLLICVELAVMLTILLYMPGKYAGACFLGFAIGECSAPRPCASRRDLHEDCRIGSDLMKVVFKIKEDDARTRA